MRSTANNMYVALLVLGILANSVLAIMLVAALVREVRLRRALQRLLSRLLS